MHQTSGMCAGMCMCDHTNQMDKSGIGTKHATGGPRDTVSQSVRSLGDQRGMFKNQAEINHIK